MDSTKRPYAPVVLALLVFPPLIFALATTPALLFWIMGASAFSGTENEFHYNLGAYALIGYLAAYATLGAVQTLNAWLKWPVVGVFHALIWLCFAAFIGTMVYVLIGLDVL